MRNRSPIFNHLVRTSTARRRVRLLGGVHALTGILMCGWSTGFFFAIVNRLYESPPEAIRS